MSEPIRGLTSQMAPPFLLPGEHFAAAMGFLLCGVIGVIVVAPQLAAGAFPAPRVIAVTHLFTLGWITTSIMGALYQFLPVALQQPVRSIRAGHIAFALYVPGVLAFVTGMMLGLDEVMLAGAATFGAGVLVFAVNLGATLRRAPRRDVTWWALAAADLFLCVTLLLGLALAGNLRWGYLGAARFTALGTHLHVALAGWVLLVIVGVAQRLLPMFLLSHGVGQHLAKAAVALLASGAAVLTVGHHGPPLVSRWLPALLLGSGLGAFLLQTLQFYRHRHRPALDPGMRLAAMSLGILALGLVLAAGSLAFPAVPRGSILYVLVLVLGISLFVVAQYYKIVPFLVWYHRYGPVAGRQPVPRVSELYSAPAASTAGALLVLGTAILTAAVALGWPSGARAGGMVLAVGVVVQAAQMSALARSRP
jgi:hypothetical protein